MARDFSQNVCRWGTSSWGRSPGGADSRSATDRGRRPRLQVRVIGLDWDIHAIAAAETSAPESENYLAGELAAQLGEQFGRQIQVAPP